MVKNPLAIAGDAREPGSIPGLGRSPGKGNNNPLQYYCLENPMDRGAWRASVHGVSELDTTEQLTIINISLNKEYIFFIERVFKLNCALQFSKDIYIYNKTFYWSTVDLKCCVRNRVTNFEDELAGGKDVEKKLLRSLEWACTHCYI